METFHSIFTGIILVILIFAVVFLVFYLKHKKSVQIQPIPQVEIPVEKQTLLPTIHIDDLHVPIPTNEPKKSVQQSIHAVPIEPEHNFKEKLPDKQIDLLGEKVEKAVKRAEEILKLYK